MTDLTDAIIEEAHRFADSRLVTHPLAMFVRDGVAYDRDIPVWKYAGITEPAEANELVTACMNTPTPRIGRFTLGILMARAGWTFNEYMSQYYDRPVYHVEAVCGRCGETYQPGDDEDDTEHERRWNGTPCGGDAVDMDYWLAVRLPYVH